MAVDVVSLSFELDATKTLQAVEALKNLGAQATQTQANLDRLNRGWTDGVTGVGNLNRAMDMLRNALVMTGVAFAGMKLTDIAYQATLAAARYETLGVVMGRISQNTNFSTQQLFQFARGIQSTGISMTESRQAVVQLIQSHLDLSRSTELARVAQDAAVVGNMNSTEAYMRLIHAIQTGITEELRAVGINVNLDVAYQQFAATLNKSVTSLTEQEKAQARMNAVIAAGTQISGAYVAAMDTAGKQLNSMKRYVDDLMTVLGNVGLPAFTRAVFSVADTIKVLTAEMESPIGRTMLDSLAQLAVFIESNMGPIIAALAAMVGVRLVASFLAFITSVERLVAVLGAVAGSPVIGVFMALGAALAFIAARQTEANTATEHGLEIHQRMTQAIRDHTAATNEQARADAMAQVDASRRAQTQLQSELAAKTQGISEGTVGITMAGVGSQLGSLGRNWFGMKTGAIPTGVAGDVEALRQMLMGITPLPAGTDARGELELAYQSIVKIREELRQAGASNDLLKNFDAMTAPIIRDRDAISGLEKGIAAAKQKADELEASINKPNREGTNLTDTQGAALKALQSIGLVYDANQGIISHATQQADANRQAFENWIRDLNSYIGEQRDLANDAAKSLDARQAAMANVTSATNTLNAALRDQGAILTAIGAQALDAYGKLLQSQQEQTQLLGAGGDPIRTAQIRAAQQVRDQFFNFDTGQLKATAEQVGKAWDEGLRAGLNLPADTSGMTTEQKAETLANAAAARAAGIAADQQAVAQRQATAEAQIRASYAARIAAAEADGAASVQRLNQQMEAAIEASKTTANWAELTARQYGEAAKNVGDLIAKLRDMARENQRSADLTGAMQQSYEAVARVQQQQKLEDILRQYIPGYAPAPKLPGMDQLLGGVSGIPITSVGGTRAVPVAIVGPGGTVTPQPGTATDATLALIRQYESGGGVNPAGANLWNYRYAENPAYYTASGFYQITNSTWRRGAQLAGIDISNYPTAHDAPFDIQTAVARALVQALGLQPWSMNARLMAAAGVGGGTVASPITPALVRAAQTNARQQLAGQTFEGITARIGGPGGGEIAQLQEQLRQEQLAGQTIGAQPWVSQRAVEDLKNQIQLEKDLGAIVSDTADKTVQQQKGEITQRYAQISALNDQLEAQRRLNAYQQEGYQLGEQMGQTITSSLVRMVDALTVAHNRGRILQQDFADLIKSLGDMILQATLFKPFENWLGGQMSGFFGNLFGSSAGSAVGASIGAKGAAHGDIFDVSTLSAYRNQILTRPTFFRFAQGGVAGEAGPEAVLPLVRLASGDLGVRSAGGGASVQVNTPITINTSGGGGGSGKLDPNAIRLLQQQLDATVRGAVRGVLVDEQRPGGDLFVGISTPQMGFR